MFTSEDRFGREYAQKRFNAAAEAIHRHFIISPETKAVDLGSGEGVFTNWLTVRGSEVVACDLDMNFLDSARKRTPQCHAVLCSAEALPLKSRSIDLSLAIDVLEHVPRFGVAARELGRVTRNTVVISIPVHGFYRKLAEAVGIDLSPYDKEAGHLHILPPSKLLRELSPLEETGMNLISIRRRFWLIPTFAKIIPFALIRRSIENLLPRIFHLSNHLVIVYQRIA